MNQKTLWVMLGGLGGLALLGTGFAAVWNSRQMKLVRGTHRAEKILYKAGTILQNISGQEE